MITGVFLKDLPTKIKAVHTVNEDGSYTIFINARLNLEQQQKGYIHELYHIINEDIKSLKEVNEIEYIAHC